MNSFVRLFWAVLFLSVNQLTPALESLPYTLPAGVPASEDSAENLLLLDKGFLSVTLQQYGADPTGQADSTAAIQQAIHDGYEHCMGVYFPSGTYTISDTLYCGQEDFTDLRTHWLVGSQAKRDAAGKVIRPVLRLADNAKGFSPATVSEKTAKHIIAFWCQRGEKDYQKIKAQPDLSKIRGSVGFSMCIKGIDIVNGAGNPGAIGLSMWSAQNSSVEDMRIDMNRGANAGFAGIGALPGVAGGATNIEVIGGRYGIYWLNGSRFPTVAGLTMRGQQELAIANYTSDSSLAITGFRIEKKSAPAIVATQPNLVGGGGMTLIDGTFEFETPSANAPVIDNTADRSFYLNNIFVKNATQLIHSGGKSPVEIKSSDQWSRIDEYYYGMKEDRGSHNINRLTRHDLKNPASQPKEPKVVETTAHASSLIDGILHLDGGQEGVGAIESVDTPPSDLIPRHLYGNPDLFSWFEGEEVIDVRRMGADGRATYDNDSKMWVGKDDTQALQAAIDRARGKQVVFLPKGTYLISQPLRLKKDTKLIGAGKNYAWIIPDLRKWRPTSTATVIDTPDEAGASVQLAWFRLSWPCEEGLNWFQPLRWRVGDDSIIRGVRLRPLWSASEESVAKTEFLIEGHGGGKIYSLIMGAKSGEDNPGHRRVLVNGTSEPLRFYHFNVEDQKSGWGAEFRNARNIAIYGFKSENQNVMLFKNCDNVLLANYGGGGPEVTFDNTRNALAANWAAQNVRPVEPEEYLLRETYEGKSEVIKNRHESPLIVFKRGTVDRTKIQPSAEAQEAKAN